jgi:hypothetical protein
MMRSEDKPTGYILRISSEKRLVVDCHKLYGARALVCQSANEWCKRTEARSLSGVPLPKDPHSRLVSPSTMKRMEVNRFG